MVDLDDTVLLGYVLGVDDDHGILALPDLDQDPAYLGHFANDGGTLPTREAELSTYVIESDDRSNARHQGIAGDSHMVTIATRNICAGEEIFVTYGPEYWKEQSTYADAAS
jgi:hypothetical protein